MNKELLCLNSDSINRYGFMCTIGALEKDIKSTLNGLPMCVNHDRHRAHGVIYPFGLYMEPHLTRLLGTKLTATNEEEQERVNNIHRYHLYTKNEEGFSPYETELLKLVKHNLTDDFKRIALECAAINDKDVAVKFFPDLFDLKDDDGLIPLSAILDHFIYQGHGCFKHRQSNLSIFAHHNFRRSQSLFNNFHFYFLNELVSLAGNNDYSIKICIDEDLIGFAPSFHQAMELQFHWGPKFNDDIGAIKPGISKYGTDERERFFSQVSVTEFYWKADANERTFELEELKDSTAPMAEIDTYNCRYVHSIYDTEKQSFVHFDGAIRSYGFEEMCDRVDKNFLEYGRKAQYKKLFRIDGKLPLSKWKLLVIHYMQDNPLVYEYFGLKDEIEALRIKKKVLTKEQALVPFALAKDSGVRLLISYHAMNDKVQQGRYIDIFDVIGDDNGKYDAVEHLVYEIKNALHKLGEHLSIPEDVFVLKILDRYWNIPSIMHNGENAEALLQKTIEALKMIFNSMAEKGIDFDIAFTLSFVLNEKIARVSCYGNIIPLLTWMEQNLPFPYTETEFSSWIEKQSVYLRQFPETYDQPLIESLVQYDGVLYIRRLPVKYEFDFFNDDRGAGFSLKGVQDDELTELINDKKVEPKMLLRLHEMTWSDTGENYFKSHRSKWLDNNVDAGVLITDWEPLTPYWSKS